MVVALEGLMLKLKLQYFVLENAAGRKSHL